MTHMRTALHHAQSRGYMHDNRRTTLQTGRGDTNLECRTLLAREQLTHARHTAVGISITKKRYSYKEALGSLLQLLPLQQSPKPQFKRWPMYVQHVAQATTHKSWRRTLWGGGGHLSPPSPPPPSSWRKQLGGV